MWHELINVCCVVPQTGGQAGSADVRRTLAELQQQNQLRSHSPPRRQRRRWSQLRSDGVLPKPIPEEEEPFILDLKNFPDLANADLGSQNPNIQARPHSIQLYSCNTQCSEAGFQRHGVWPMRKSPCFIITDKNPAGYILIIIDKHIGWQSQLTIISVKNYSVCSFFHCIKLYWKTSVVMWIFSSLKWVWAAQCSHKSFNKPNVAVAGKLLKRMKKKYTERGQDSYGLQWITELRLARGNYKILLNKLD